MQISSKAHTLFAYNFLMDGPIRIFGILNCIDNQKKVAQIFFPIYICTFYGGKRFLSLYE